LSAIDPNAGGFTTAMADVASVANTDDVLGEAPRWHPTEKALYWIDLFKPAIHRFDPATGKIDTWAPNEKLGSFAPCAGGGLLLAGRNGLSLFDPQSAAKQRLVDPERGGPENILNDGRCDCRGRFWVGSMNKMIQRASGRLYCYAEGKLRVADEGFWVSNGVCWSPDNRRMYFADSHIRTIFCYDFDADDGVIANRREFTTLGDVPGVPDGASTDAEGFLWCAIFDGNCLVRYAPDGTVNRTVKLPVSRPSACAFGGPNLDILYVTTARFRLPPDKLVAEPLAGSLLALDVGVKGTPETLFAG
jgi:sugar lactone lactonase YvrE